MLHRDVVAVRFAAERHSGIPLGNEAQNARRVIVAPVNIEEPYRLIRRGVFPSREIGGRSSHYKTTLTRSNEIIQ